MKKIIKTNKAPQAIGPYNQAIISSQFIFVSGQIPLDQDGKLVSDDIQRQTLQCLNNIESILKEIKIDKSNIVKTTIFLQNIEDFLTVNEVYANFFKGTLYPARSTIEVSRLPKDVKIEIEAIAVRS